MFLPTAGWKSLRFWTKCLLAGGICLLIVQAVFIFLWPVFVAAGLLHNFGMLMRLPSTQFSPSDMLFLRGMASMSAFLFLGPALAAFPTRAWVSLFGLGPPWGLMTVFGLISPSFPGGIAARLENGCGFMLLGLVEWSACVEVFFLLRRLGAFPTGMD